MEGTSGRAAEGTAPPRIGGRYVLRHQIGSGGMATVYLGYDEQATGARRRVAIKRMHPWLLKEPEFVATLLDEGRLVSHVAHPNVVRLREVVVQEHELFLVLEFVQGEPLSALVRALEERGGNQRIPAPVTCALVRDLLRGLHAAHDATDEKGRPLGIVHRDVSPHNMLVGIDGRAHLLDFGIAKAAGRSQSTRDGNVKGKLAYMAPEQLRAGVVTRRSDVYAASIVFWEMLTGRRIFGRDPLAQDVRRQMKEPFQAPSAVSPGSPVSLDAVVLRGLARDPQERFGSAAEMADAIERGERCAAPAAIAAWLRTIAAPSLEAQARLLAELETPVNEPREEPSPASEPESSSGASEAVTLAFDNGQLIAGRYRILDVLGAGGMGTVYKARDVELDVLVALKVLRRELVGAPGVLERFRREVKLARRVTHRNVARAHDIGEHEGERFLTMELVDGESLRQLLERERRLPVWRVLEIAFALCDGLEAAHRVGVVHRDLKPDNVLMAVDGRVVVTDFGIARAVDPGAVSPTVGLVVGTPGYMAPEQVEGSVELDARADIYALGVILFELFTGRRPFEPQSVPFARASLRLDSPPDPQPLGAPAAAAPVIIRCLERERSERFSSVREVADALHAVPIESRPPPIGAPGAPPNVRSTQRFSLRLTPRSVAVLPLRNGGLAEDDYLAEGLTDDLIDQLSMTTGLRVRPRGAVAHLKGATRDVRALGAELGVDVVVEGSVRKTNDMVRIVARVISVADGFQLWAKRFDLEAARVLAVTDEVAKAVAHALTTSPGSPERVPPSNPEALDLYFRARHEYNAFEAVAAGSPLPTLRAAAMNSVELFDKAHALAPDDPMILSGYVLAHARTWFFGDPGPREQAFESAARAVELAPARGESYLARASVDFQRGDLAASIKDARRALSLAPTLADAHELLGRILCETGPAQEGIQHMRSAVELEPGFRFAHAATLRVSELLGNRAEADRLADEIVAHDEWGAGWTVLARVVLWRADEKRARALFDHPVIQSGKAPSAREILRLVIEPETVPSPGKLVAASLGTIGASWRMPVFLEQARTEFSAARGKVDDAFAALAASVDAGLIDLLWMDGCPLLRPLRADARFPPLRARVVERVGLVRAALDAPDLA